MEEYKDGKIYIEEEFVFEFQENSFISPASLPIMYEIKLLKEDGKYHNIPVDYWLQP